MTLKLQHITQQFQDGDDTLTVVENLDFEVNKGELVAIIGPSGCGKSTVLSIAGALQTPTSGDVFINGKNISNYPKNKLADVRLKNIGYIFQASNLVPFLMVKDQLKVVADLNNTWDEKRADELLEAVGMSHRKKQHIQHLSGGEKQRVAIARAFMNDPELILADEPTASLDASRSEEIVALIAHEVHTRNKAAVIVTHDESVLPYCDIIYEMQQGKLVKQKETSQ
ncbi:hemin ABC transporter ATP-binding protein [Kurthia sp. 3B1D]|uniref:Putative hemin import ATP-binding protein HrtA n=1 Tax=Candidatus Kurthia intestinigallinarum TaxID=1562256 RepID=A0A433RQ03_9BACL|nr:ABC transporter ATP-binding protein [Kurthia sp. 3B1D]RUS52482.1 hemin ABC transporter ATP-binding protein [Kurthia sp. 3B1D]